MTSTESRRKSLRELRESTGTLFAKNNTPHKITCNTDQISFELEPAGNDDSIRILPKECLNVPGFQRLWMKKSVTVSDDDEMESEIVLLMGGQVESTIKPVAVMRSDGTWAEETPAIQEPSGKKDFTMAVDEKGQPIGRTCLIGGEPVYQTEKSIEAGEPPLCPTHQGESHRVVSTPQPDGTWVHRLTVVESKNP